MFITSFGEQNITYKCCSNFLIHLLQQISDQEKMRQMEREIKELKRANEILRKAAAFFAQAELDRPHK